MSASSNPRFPSADCVLFGTRCNREKFMPLKGKIALVAGATRGAGRGIAVQLGGAGATVYVTGRTSGSRRSEMNRPETIEETMPLVDPVGFRGSAVQVDHLAPVQI